MIESAAYSSSVRWDANASFDLETMARFIKRHAGWTLGSAGRRESSGTARSTVAQPITAWSSTAGDDFYALLNVKPLATQIWETYQASSIDDEARVSAECAVQDAAVFANESLGLATPSVFVSSDGGVLLQWQTNSFGLALLFTGDETVVFSIKEPGTNYADNGIEFPLSEPPPPALIGALARLGSG